MRTRSFSEPEVLVSGRRLGLSLLASIGAAAGVGIVSYYGLIGQWTVCSDRQCRRWSRLRCMQCLWPYSVTRFGHRVVLPLRCALRASRISGSRSEHSIALIAVCTLAYAFLGLFFGGFLHLLKQLTAVATDAKRLQGQGSSAWVIAILRSCLLVPIFEEVFFRGLLLTWLNRHMRFAAALVVHGCAVCGDARLSTCAALRFPRRDRSWYVRRATGSTINTVLMHAINNIVLLRLGLYFFGHQMAHAL